MPALARSSPTASAHHRTAVPERSRFGADRGSTWRGSRRDVDWINRLEARGGRPTGAARRERALSLRVR